MFIECSYAILDCFGDYTILWRTYGNFYEDVGGASAVLFWRDLCKDFVDNFEGKYEKQNFLHTTIHFAYMTFQPLLHSSQTLNDLLKVAFLFIPPNIAK